MESLHETLQWPLFYSKKKKKTQVSVLICEDYKLTSILIF